MNKKAELKQIVLRYLSNHNMFWLSELKKHCGFTNPDSKDGSILAWVCREMCKEGIIFASERKGNRIQYIKSENYKIVNIGGNYTICKALKK